MQSPQQLARRFPLVFRAIVMFLVMFALVTPSSPYEVSAQTAPTPTVAPTPLPTFTCPTSSTPGMLQYGATAICTGTAGSTSSFALAGAVGDFVYAYLDSVSGVPARKVTINTCQAEGSFATLTCVLKDPLTLNVQMTTGSGQGTYAISVQKPASPKGVITPATGEHWLTAGGLHTYTFSANTATMVRVSVANDGILPAFALYNQTGSVNACTADSALGDAICSLPSATSSMTYTLLVRDASSGRATNGPARAGTYQLFIGSPPTASGSVTIGAVQRGLISSKGEVDAYTLILTQTETLLLRSAPFNKVLEPRVKIFPTNQTNAVCESTGNTTRVATIAGCTLAPGTYEIRLKDKGDDQNPNGDNVGEYGLQIHALRNAPSSSQIAIGTAYYNNAITVPGEARLFSFDATSNKNYRVTVTAPSGADPVIGFFNGTGAMASGATAFCGAPTTTTGSTTDTRVWNCSPGDANLHFRILVGFNGSQPRTGTFTMRVDCTSADIC